MGEGGRGKGGGVGGIIGFMQSKLFRNEKKIIFLRVSARRALAAADFSPNCVQPRDINFIPVH